MRNIFIQGIGLVRHSRVLLLVIITGVLFGAFSEGFDRLWTPHMLESFTFPTIGDLKPVVWFGIIGMVEAALSIVLAEMIKRKIDLSNHRATVMMLIITNLILMAGVIGFAIVSNFTIAVLLYWLGMSFRWAREPVFIAWVNQSITPRIRATMFSVCSQADAIGQLVGGPIIGVIALAVSVKAGIIASGLILVPIFFLYLYVLKRGKCIKKRIGAGAI